MSWKLAKSLETLRSQINALAPGRDKTSDGTIGDARHAAGSSDHNPDRDGVVCAMDITHDPAHGVDAGKLADVLRQSHDKRIKYIISNRRIASSTVFPWRWRPYTGASPHTAHFHVSVMQAGKNDPQPWKLELSPLVPASPAPGESQGPSTAKDPKFHSLVPGGYFSSTPFDTKLKTSIRTNNPGALNVAPWVRLYPGFIGDKITSMSGASPNSTVIFETPEHGVAAWWELLRQYREEPSRRPNAKTLRDIIIKYGGGQANYPAYAATVVVWSGLPATHDVRLTGDDANLLKFAKALFRYEAGENTPLSDAQILFGFDLARKKHGACPTCEHPHPQTYDERWVQSSLNKLGAKPPLDVDGDIGRLSKAAIRAFQKANGLTVDGDAGAATVAAIVRKLA
jgi:hypothetical protein